MSTLKSSIRTERSLVAGEMSHHGKAFISACDEPCVPATPLAVPAAMKPKLRGATTADINLANEWRHSLKGYTQDSILLMFAIVYNDWRALQGTVAKQREVLAAAAKSAPKTPADKSLGKRVYSTAPAHDPEVLRLVRQKFRELSPS